MTATPTSLASQTSDLIAWARRLAEAAGPAADPAGHAACQTAKTDLLTRLTSPTTPPARDTP